MRVLLLHPDDTPESGEWAGTRWDLVVDLGWAGQCANARMAKMFACPVRSIQELADPQAHAAKLREVLTIGLGILVDRLGIDWWEFANPYRQPLLDQILQATQLSKEISPHAELVATRPHLLVRILEEIRGSEIRTLLPLPNGLASSIRHYARLQRILSPSALLQIAFDKWDADYSVRRWFSSSGAPRLSGTVLLPSAYRNVTRTQMAFARMLPEHRFLSVVTRRDGRTADTPANVTVCSLAAYARKRQGQTECELRDLTRAWSNFGAIKSDPDLQIAGRLGAFNNFPKFLATGLRVRDAWDAVLQIEKILSVLSADENNPFTRLPVWLASQRGIHTVYAEHGALNFNLALRVPCSESYLARGEMMKDYWLRYCHLPAQRIELGAPHNSSEASSADPEKRGLIVFFSSDYESFGGRVGDFYGEVLPALCDLAEKCGRRVVLKLHPFESLPERRRRVDAILTPNQRARIELRAGPLDSELLHQTWIAFTVESSAAVECALAGIPTFLCSWFDTAWWDYGKQFVRFAVAQPLNSPEEIAAISRRIDGTPRPEKRALTVPIARERLESILGMAASNDAVPVRPNLALP